MTDKLITFSYWIILIVSYFIVGKVTKGFVSGEIFREKKKKSSAAAFASRHLPIFSVTSLI